MLIYATRQKPDVESILRGNEKAPSWSQDAPALCDEPLLKSRRFLSRISACAPLDHEVDDDNVERSAEIGQAAVISPDCDTHVLPPHLCTPHRRKHRLVQNNLEATDKGAPCCDEVRVLSLACSDLQYDRVLIDRQNIEVSRPFLVGDVCHPFRVDLPKRGLPPIAAAIVEKPRQCS